MEHKTDIAATRIEEKLDTCPHCKKRPLWSHDERYLRICNQCADRQYERYQERMEWGHYHHD